MKRSFKTLASTIAASLAITLGAAQPSLGYSVLTHEAIIDAVWDDSIRPLLLRRFPRATADQLREGHAYAYGGAIIQDMGYYPFGRKFFTDLVHYVRSGDFIEALLQESQDLNEYAFALGALAHYAADNEGHSIAVNRAVPALYPKLRVRYGNRVTYAEDPTAHLRTEFGFDVLQVARNRYAPDSYHDFIGFEVSKELLERAFKKTYGLDMKDLFGNLDLALGTYRRAVSVVIPTMTKVAWETKKDEIEKTNKGMTREKFIYQLSRADYEKDWGRGYEKPGALEKSLAVLFRVVPKVGPFRTLSFKTPTPEAEQMFLQSMNATLVRYRELLRESRTGRLNLQNKNFDTGNATRAGEYTLADQTYAQLLDKLDRDAFKTASAELRRNILAFYRDLDAPIDTKRHRQDWQNTLQSLSRLKASATSATRTR